ncbi:hypothetical protein [Streptomyces formicae]|uniref:Uncharacterized protein n=1 Tax=Streptomyces formicae TaxID=1616117 RepID=A0ABY3WMF2_9ACTN|nr:hypothetical protein [Streptomyces formicae]UNM13828.1 hypothetical protein J4032_22300 [Streptomyces formicae]
MTARDELDRYLSQYRAEKRQALLDAFRAEVLREGAAMVEDRACDADFTEEPLYIVGLRSAADLLKAASSSGPAAGEEPFWMRTPALEGAPQCGETHRPSGAGACVLPAGHGGRVHQDRHTNQWPAAGDKQPETEVERLRAELAKYVGKEPTVVEEMAYLNRCLNAVHDVCDAAEKQATRWEQPLPVPEWVATVREAATGERTDNPNDRRRRIYIDGNGDAWLDQSVTSDGTRWIAPLAGSMPTGSEAEAAVRGRTGSLREIGRCW